MGKKMKSPSFILDKDFQPQPKNRSLLIHGWVKLTSGLKREKRYLFLYKDLLIVAKVKRKKLEIKHKIHLSNVWTASHVNEEGEGDNSTTSFLLGWPMVNYMACFNSREKKEKWLHLLQRYIKAEKEKDEPKRIPLKIYLQDIDNCFHYKTIAVKNSDTASEVISMSLPMLRINGSEKDYQLWVDSGKEAAPYPLIGHEYPYEIKKCHLQEAVLMAEGSKDCTTTSNFLEPFLREDVPLKMRCQFILKPRHLTVSQQPNGWNILRSFINWACCCSSSPDLDTSPSPAKYRMAAKSPTPGQLFGVPLGDICEGENLPKPVSDMLYYINKKGPLTIGVFRESANIDSCEELKEKLNNGLEVNLDCEPVFVLASVLKDFLRHIPGSIFTSDLYSQWVNVMNQGDNEDKINTIQSLLEKLPIPNRIVINHLFGVLKNIMKHSSINKMTAYNLAICIGPSLLWSPVQTVSSLEVEIQLLKKVSSLIQFMIENADIIFENIHSPWEEDLVACHNREDSPGHEDPHAIEVNPPEDVRFLTPRSGESASSSKVLEDFPMEEMTQRMQRQYILKPNHLTVSQKSSGSTTECFCRYALVLAAPIGDFRMEGSPQSVLRSLWLRSFPEESVCLSSTSFPTTFGFIGFGYCCIANVVTISQGQSKMCSKVQSFMVPAAQVLTMLCQKKHPGTRSRPTRTRRDIQRARAIRPKDRMSQSVAP